MQYHPALGPDVTVQLAYNANHQVSAVDSNYWQGAVARAIIGAPMALGLALSFPSWAWISIKQTPTFFCPGWLGNIHFAGATNIISTMNYMHNTVLQKVMSGTNVTALILNQVDGSQANYTVVNTNNTSISGVYFLSSVTDPAGHSNIFAYNTNFCLTNLTAADGATFSLQYTNTTLTNYITSITTSYGAAVNFQYGSSNYGVLTAVTDAAGIKSQFYYLYAWGGPPTALVTPYGTTYMNLLGMTNSGNSEGIFTRTAQLTQPDGSVEFYGLMTNNYTGGDWPNFLSAQIPTNTPVGHSGHGHPPTVQYFLLECSTIPTHLQYQLEQFQLEYV